MIVYKFINPEDIPDNLSIGEEFKPQCLFVISPKTES